MLFSLLCRAFVIYQFPIQANFALLAQMPVRPVEFGWGIMAARLYVMGTVLPVVLRKGGGFAIGFLLAYLGRVMMTTEVAQVLGGIWGRIFAEPILTLGCTIILLNVISSDSLFRRLLRGEGLLAVGKISYSLYLRHPWFGEWTSRYVLHVLKLSQVTGQPVSFFIQLLLLLPFCALSYQYLEAPYFKNVSTSA